jgi:hypothetical protein
MKIVMLAYPDMTPLDLMGPLQAWSLWPGTSIQVVWKTLEPVPTDTGMAIVPTHVLSDAEPNPDILFVGGGVAGTFRILEDPEIMEFLQARGKNASWITSVCTGALVLGPPVCCRDTMRRRIGRPWICWRPMGQSMPKVVTSLTAIGPQVVVLPQASILDWH